MTEKSNDVICQLILLSMILHFFCCINMTRVQCPECYISFQFNSIVSLCSLNYLGSLTSDSK